jgi:hypothetical protein
VRLAEERRLLADSSSSIVVLNHILHMEGGVQMKVIVLLWQWWNERNRVREGGMRNADDLAFVIQQKSAEEFLNMNRKKEAKVAGPNPAWSKPPRDFLKINSDSSFLAITGQGG